MPKKIECGKCGRNITSNNISRHKAACIGPVTKKIRGVDFDPNAGYADGRRVAWNKGVQIGPNETLKQHYDALRKSRDTTDFKSIAAIRRKIIEEQCGKCYRCGLDTWQGQRIMLELEHKNGIRTDNRKENLECLCPNCHAMTDTWRGKNRSRFLNSMAEY